MGNEGRAKVTRLHRARDINRGKPPSSEPAPAQAVVIIVDNTNHMARDLFITAINHQKWIRSIQKNQ